MDVWTFWKRLYSCSAFKVVSDWFRNHHAKFEIDRTMFKLTKKPNRLGQTDGRTGPNYRKASLKKKFHHISLHLLITLITIMFKHSQIK